MLERLPRLLTLIPSRLSLQETELRSLLGGACTAQQHRPLPQRCTTGPRRQGLRPEAVASHEVRGRCLWQRAMLIAGAGSA